MYVRGGVAAVVSMYVCVCHAAAVIVCMLWLQKWTLHRGMRRKSGSPPRAGQPVDEHAANQVRANTNTKQLTTRTDHHTNNTIVNHTQPDTPLTTTTNTTLLDTSNTDKLKGTSSKTDMCNRITDKNHVERMDTDTSSLQTVTVDT